MDFRIFLEWSDECGLPMEKMYPLQEEIEKVLLKNQYGSSINKIRAIVIARPHNFKQRKRFRKDAGIFDYDVILDFYLIKNVEPEEKKRLIRYLMIKTTEETFKKYKFEDFDTTAFLSDFKNTVERVKW
jgi:hypothetical protein